MKTQMLELGAVFSWEPGGHDKQVIDKARKIARLAYVDGDEIIEPGKLRIEKPGPSWRWDACGLPVRVSKADLEKIENYHKELKGQLSAVDWYDHMIGVVQHTDGHYYVLTPVKGAWRIPVNVKARLNVASYLGCEYVQEDGMVYWVGDLKIQKVPA